MSYSTGLRERVKKLVFPCCEDLESFAESGCSDKNHGNPERAVWTGCREGEYLEQVLRTAAKLQSCLIRPAQNRSTCVRDPVETKARCQRSTVELSHRVDTFVSYHL